VTTDDTDIVSALRSALAQKVGARRFELWFGSASLGFDGRSLAIGLPNRFVLDWLRANFRREIDEACEETLRYVPAVSFHVDDPSDASPNRDAEPAVSPRATLVARETLSRPRLHLRRQTAPEETLGTGPEAGNQGSRHTPCADRGTASRKFAALEAFVPGDCNRLALESARRITRHPGEMTPLLIYGPTAVGKTHLLEGIWTAARRTHRDLRSIFLSAEQFTTYFVEALRGSGLPNFRRKYRDVGLLILDDLQFMAGKRATQIELLHTIDTLLRKGRQLVLSADRSPAELAELGPELVSRLQSGMVCRIDRPDFATRRGIVAQMAGRMRVDVPPEVQDFLAARLTGHARELSGGLCRLQATSDALGQPIALPMAEEALAEMIRHSGRLVRLGDIERAVCRVFGVESDSLQSGRKAKSVSHPRMLAMWLARKHTRAALSEIGHYFGRRSHSTVVSAQKRVDKWMATGQTLQVAERTWNVDDAIRQLEQHLLAG
jgi:chromosomal replication initiator protein